MRQLQLSIFLFLALIQNVNSQEKVMKGDTAFWNKRNKELIKKLELIDLSKSQADFAFRFWNYGQVVEILKANNQICGELTNYIYHSTQKRHEILKHKIQLDASKSLEAYEIIQKSGILALQPDNNINRCSRDGGINYWIEHSDKYNYWVTNCWTTSAHDSIQASLSGTNFMKSLSNVLQLSESYKKFKEDLPHKGCYSSGGGTRYCYISNSFGFGYLGSTKLPLGFNSSAYMTYIGKMYTNFGFNFQYKTDGKENYDLGFEASKNRVFIKKSKTNDFLIYGYQKKKLDFVDTNKVSHDHQLRYGILMNNNFSISSGLAYRIDNKEKPGGVFAVSKWFVYPKIDATFISSIFEDEIDYKTGISKSIHFFTNKPIIRSTSVGLYFENFKHYNDLNISLTLWL